jgi:hypothetical protein
MNILSHRLEKTKSIPETDKALLLKEAEEYESNGETPLVAAQMAIKNAGQEIEDIFDNLVSASEDSGISIQESLHAFWSDDAPILLDLPKTHIELACALADAGVRSESELIEVLGTDSLAWAGPFARWIEAKYADGEDTMTVDQLSSAVLEGLTGVTSQWLSPVRPVFERLAALAMSKHLTDEDFIAALQKAQREMPELFDLLDTEALQTAFENALGSAALAGSVSRQNQ